MTGTDCGTKDFDVIVADAQDGSGPLPCVQQHKLFEFEALQFTPDPDLGINQAVSACVRHHVTDPLSFYKELPHNPHAYSYTPMSHVQCHLAVAFVPELTHHTELK